MIYFVRQMLQRNFNTQAKRKDNYTTSVICPSCSNVQYADARFCNKCRYIL